MLFYMCNVPTATALDLETVQDIVMERYDCYSKNTPECDISKEFDLVGHFIMCVIASRCESLRDLIVEEERKLFLMKLTTVNAEDLRNEIYHAVRFLSSLEKIEDRPTTNFRQMKEERLIIKILKTMECKSSHVFHNNHRSDCRKFEMVLPFTFPLSMVANREVEVSGGKAAVPCGKWKELLENIFIHLVEFEISFFEKFKLLQGVINEMEDDRWRIIIENCIGKMMGRTPCLSQRLVADEIDWESQYFPPCIADLHQMLRKTHRLSYDSRYLYTLFLKDIGLPVSENIWFWKSEYTKPHHSSSKCTHSWGEKMSRYEYQINHMYGLIGSRTLKTSHSCEKFIGKLTLRMNGACPFAHLSGEELARCLPSDLAPDDIEDILKYKASNRPQWACAVYFRHCHGGQDKSRTNKRPAAILSPVHYYSLARGLDSC